MEEMVGVYIEMVGVYNEMVGVSRANLLIVIKRGTRC